VSAEGKDRGTPLALVRGVDALTPPFDWVLHHSMEESRSITHRPSGANGAAPAENGRALSPYAAQFDQDNNQGPDYRRVLQAVRRFKWIALGILIVGSALSGFVAMKMPRSYRASATIWIAAQGESRRMNDVGPIKTNQLLDAEAWVDLLHSYAVLDPVVLAMRLYVHPKEPADSIAFSGFSVGEGFKPGEYTVEASRDGSFSLRSATGAVVDHGKLSAGIGAPVGFKWTPTPATFPTGRPIPFTITTPRGVSESIARDMEIRIDRSGALLKLELPGAEPRRIAAIVNGIANRFVVVAADLKDRRLAELRRILDEQRVGATAELARAENALQTFREHSVGLPATKNRGVAEPAGVDPTTELGLMRTELEGVQHDVRALQAWLSQPAEQRSVNGALLLTTTGEAAEYTAALDTLLRKRSELRSLEVQYLPAHPRVVKLTEEVNHLTNAVLPSLASRLAKDLATRERDLAARSGSMSVKLRSVPARMAEESQLERAVTIASDLYTTLQQRYQEASLAVASSLPDARVLDAAEVPYFAFANKAPRILLVGCAASLVFAIVLAVGLDRIDPRVRYPTEVTHRLGLTILGAVPHRKVPNGNKAHAWDVANEVTEALRGVRLAMTNGATNRDRVLYTITSAGPGDGKSFITANLGLSYAMAGYKTVIVDGDTRRGVLHRNFAAMRRPGLTEFLNGAADSKEIRQPTFVPALTIIGAGARTRVAPELLGKPEFAGLIAELMRDYDVVLCDSPPLAAGVDPLVIGTVTRDMIVVVRTGVSLRSVLEAKLEILDRLPVNIVGAVMNDVPDGDVYAPYLYQLAGYDGAEEPDEPSMMPVV
jgi:succinoglycan biosynthesis transport protein ExoP